MIQKPYTQDDIAKKLNVSRVTVSHVLNQRSDNWISEELRENILAAAKEMNYQAPARKKRTSIKSLALITPSVEAEIYVRLIRGVTRVAEEQEYSLMVSGGCNDLEDERRRLAMMLRRGVDGIILSPIPRIPEEVEKFSAEMAAIARPVVCVDTYFRGAEVSRVLFDYETCCRDLVKKLAAEGRTKIGFINYLTVRHPVLDRRYDGYRLGLSDCGLPEIPGLTQYRATKFDAHTGLTFDLPGMVDNFLKAGAQAIIANTDHMAVEIVNLLRERRADAPGGVRVIGFDDLTSGRINSPAITTVSQPWEKMGEIAAEILLEQSANGRRQVRQIALAPELVVRDT